MAFFERVASSNILIFSYLFLPGKNEIEFIPSVRDIILFHSGELYDSSREHESLVVCLPRNDPVDFSWSIGLILLTG